MAAKITWMTWRPNFLTHSQNVTCFDSHSVLRLIQMTISKLCAVVLLPQWTGTHGSQSLTQWNLMGTSGSFELDKFSSLRSAICALTELNFCLEKVNESCECYESEWLELSWAAIWQIWCVYMKGKRTIQGFSLWFGVYQNWLIVCCYVRWWPVTKLDVFCLHSQTDRWTHWFKNGMSHTNFREMLSKCPFQAWHDSGES